MSATVETPALLDDDVSGKRRRRRPGQLGQPQDRGGSRVLATVDGTQSTDGAATDRTSLPGFPNGLLVVHDGENDGKGAARDNTNLKYLDAAILVSRR